MKRRLARIYFSRIQAPFKAALVALVLAAGLWALVYEQSPSNEISVSLKPAHIQNIYKSALNTIKGHEAADRLMHSLKQDELGGENPFVPLSATEAWVRLFAKEIATFHRETLRSPSYKGEAGYDLVHYEITYVDKSEAQVLAYLEVGDPVVMLLSPHGSDNLYSLFRAGLLEESTTASESEAELMIAKRLDSGVPFVSVSR